MLKKHPSIPMIEIVAEGMRKIAEIDAVFVGGATTCLYIDDESLGQVRPTKDVDCTIEVTSYSKYTHLEESLRANGFRNVVEPGAPLCRWIYNSVIVDIMPDDESVIGFTNSWYKEGRLSKIPVTLPSGCEIYIFPIEYFFASKIEAFIKRGNNDYYGSKDIEDIITVLDGFLHLDSILNENNRVTRYVMSNFYNFCNDNDFVQSLTGHIEFSDSHRAERIYRFMNS